MPIKNNKRKEKKSAYDYGYLIRQFYAVLIYLTVFVISCLITLVTDVSLKNIYYITLIQFSVSSFITGFIFSYKIRKNGLLNGVLGTLPINILLLIISVILNAFTFDINLLFSFFAALCSSAVGGVVAVNIKLRR